MRQAAKRMVEFIGSSRKDLKAMPVEVQRDIGFALDFAQRGSTHPMAKPLVGFNGVSVMEIVARHDTNTYRGIYTVKFESVLYVLHCFQKKSKTGAAMTQQDKDLLRSRLADAEQLHGER